MLYRNSLPEVNGSTEKSSEVPIVQDAPKPTLKWLWLLMTLILVAAVAIGVGVGIWYTRRSESSEVRYCLLRCYTFPFTHSYSHPVASPSAPGSPRARTPKNPSTAQYILNDTSLAAVTLPNNDRHLYFQDSTGRIRYVIRTASTNQWNTSPDSSITASAKNHTPLAATAFKPDGPAKVWAAILSTLGALSS